VNCLAFSPDNQHILSGSLDSDARLWLLGTERALKTFDEHILEITCVAWAPDGRQWLTGSRDRTARIRSHRGNKYNFKELRGRDGDDVLSAAWSPDGSRVFTGSLDRRLRAWDAATGELLAIMEGQSQPVRLIAVSPNGKYVLAGGAYDQVCLWLVDGGTPYKLVGAYATSKTVQALCWLDNEHFLLADDQGSGRCPRIYRLHLEGC
jgi:WD40 repeat protein